MNVRCFLWRQNNPEVNYSPNRISGGGGGGLFMVEMSCRRYEIALNEGIVLEKAVDLSSDRLLMNEFA
jgi:hypothetical protein